MYSSAFCVNDSGWETDQRSGFSSRFARVRYVHVFFHQHGYRRMKCIGCICQRIRSGASVGVRVRDIGEQDDKAVAVSPDSSRVKQHVSFLLFEGQHSFNILCSGSTAIRADCGYDLPWHFAILKVQPAGCRSFLSSLTVTNYSNQFCLLPQKGKQSGLLPSS